MHTMVRWWCLTMVMSCLACVSRTEPPPSKLAEGCLVNSDCESPLVCAFRRCHTQCETARDCESGYECVPADPRPFNVCLLADERSCRGQPCPAPMVCGPDQTCRAPCSAPGAQSECLKEQACVPGPVCASTPFIVDGGLPQVAPVTPRCARNSDCASPLVCNQGTGACQRECLVSRDCAAGLACEIDAGVCAVPRPTINGQPVSVPVTWGQSCVFDSECWAGGAPPDLDGGALPSNDPRILICGSSSRCTYECIDGRSCSSRVCAAFRCLPVSGAAGGTAAPRAGRLEAPRAERLVAARVERQVAPRAVRQVAPLAVRLVALLAAQQVEQLVAPRAVRQGERLVAPRAVQQVGQLVAPRAGQRVERLAALQVERLAALQVERLGPSPRAPARRRWSRQAPRSRSQGSRPWACSLSPTDGLKRQARWSRSRRTIR
jgi:hypothetical protein